MQTRTFLALAALLFCARPLAYSQSLSLTNPGFETGLDRWFASDSDKAAGLSKALPASARTGKSGLHVSQTEDTPTGSWLASERLSIEFGTAYRLSFWARTVAPSGIGVWVNYLDAERQAIKTPEQIHVNVKQSPGDWELYTLDLSPPAGAAFVTFAVHGFSKHTVDADFDDFSLVALPAAAR